jgi:hypothetical protein
MQRLLFILEFEGMKMFELKESKADAEWRAISQVMVKMFDVSKLEKPEEKRF